MNDAALIDTQIISDIVLSAQELISEQLSSLLNNDSLIENTTTGPNIFETASNDILVQLENIGVIADMSGLKGLNAVCLQFSTQLVDLALCNKQDAIVIKTLLDTWLLDILDYLKDWQSIENVEHLVDSISDKNNSIRDLLLKDIETNASESENDNDLSLDESDLLPSIEESDDDMSDLDALFAVDDDPDSDIDFETPEGIMALLCTELHELQPKISSLTDQIINSDEQNQTDAAIEYEDIINRFRNTCDELDLSGLVQICKFVLTNINLILTLDAQHQANAKNLLSTWPQIVIDHLQAPADDTLCLAVVNFLENESWPKPLKYSDQRNLIDGLTKQLELTGDFKVEARSVVAHANDVALDIAEDTNQQLLDAFFAECPGYAEDLTMRIAEIIKGNAILDNTKAAQRISHTLKGSANLIGTKGIASLAHHLEDIFEYLAKQAIAPPTALGNTMSEAADTIEVMIESLQGLGQTPVDAQRVLQDVLDWANRIDKGEISTDTTISEKESPKIIETIITDSNELSTSLETESSTDTTLPEQNELIRVPRDMMDQIFNLIGETSIAISQVQEQLKRMHDRGNDMHQQEKNLQSRRFELENLVSVRSLAATQKHLTIDDDQQFDSLEMDEYGEFYSATHSFIEAVSDSHESSHDIMTHIMDLEGLFLQHQRLNRSLQNIVMTTRMVPVKTIVARLQRTVRQACRATDKQAELEIIGEQILMDGDVLNQIADPIMHLLRNAIDHGIEPVTQRREKGKPDTGKITLTFYHEGNNIRAKCSDDGAGLDYERIRWVAMERNLINPEDEIDNATIARVILNSGFSTRETTTQISGRGVGMDVVHTAVLKLKGSIDIKDNEPSGTIFNLRLPITLLTSHSILVESHGTRYAIPTTMLDQILPSGTGYFNNINGNQTFQLDKRTYTAKSLSHLLGLSGIDKTVKTNTDIVLLVHHHSEIVAITVKRVLSNHDLVIKNMGNYVKHITGITGVALLGDGGVVPVLDMVELLDLNKSGKQTIQSSHEEAVEKLQLSTILIVDDSLSVRKSLSQLVSDAGYEPLLARDGLEALDIMQKTKPDLILTDLEMPRMTGLELTSHVRADAGNADLPIFMITSRTMAKHQTQAHKVGVNEYITKPFSEDDLIAKLGQALNG